MAYITNSRVRFFSVTIVCAFFSSLCFQVNVGVVSADNSSGLSQGQQDLFKQNISYFDLNSCSVYTSSSSGSSSTSSSSSVGIPSLVGGTPAQQAFNYYVGQGLSAMAAAGLVGNFMQESGGNTENLDPTVTNGIGAHGIAQWYEGRLTNLINFASSKSVPEDSLATQLAFSWNELTGSDASVLSKLKQVSSASLAADIVNSNGPPAYSGGYEGSGVPPTQREANAILIFNKYGSGSGGTAGSVSSSSTSSGCSSTSATSTTNTSSISAYKNPLRDVMANNSLFARRIDQGVDYGGHGPIYALGDGKVDLVYHYNEGSGWPGIGGVDNVGGWVSYTLSDGPAVGKIVYFAENCQPTVKQGDLVTPDTVICQMDGETASWIETGWAASATGTATMAMSCWDNVSSMYGVNFSQLLQKLGAPPGITQEPNPPCTLPSDWPTWQ